MTYSTRYYEYYDRLVDLYYSTSECTRKLVFLCLLLILRNGLRASESIIAVDEFMKSLSRVVVIQSLKKGNKRHVVLPDEISLFDILELKQCINEVNRYLIKDYSKRYLKTRPHDLRRLYINALNESGYTLEKIQQVVGHKYKKNTEYYIIRG